MRAIHGPTAMTIWSAWMAPVVVSTRVTAPEPSDEKPVTSTPVSMVAPAARAKATLVTAPAPEPLRALVRGPLRPLFLAGGGA